MYAHYTAHARGALTPLADGDVCRWLWCRLREAFPDAIAVVLMPDHPHLIAPFFDRARRRLAAILAACARRFGLGEIWHPIPEPATLTTADKLARGVRYTALNCSRPWKHGGRAVQLVRDPLAWRWSTLRDAIGAIADPWVSPERLASALAWPLREFARRFHRYVSSDPHVSPGGTPFPVAARPSEVPQRSLEEIARAALAAVRADPEALRRRTPARRLFAALARHQGWRSPTMIGDRCGIRPSNVQRLAASCPPEWLEAAALCLGDGRLSAPARSTLERPGPSPRPDGRPGP